MGVVRPSPAPGGIHPRAADSHCPAARIRVDFLGSTLIDRCHPSRSLPGGMMHIPRLLRPCTLAALLGTALLGSAADVRAAANNRLDRDVLPTFESVRLKLDPTLPDYSGVVHIDLTVVTPSESFRLYAKDMDVIRVMLTGPAGPVAVRFEAGDGGQLIVHAEQPLAAGAYGLDIDFRNDFDVKANSLYRVKAGVDWYCYTQFEASAARQAFPCWDEPEFKIPFQITVTVPEADAAVSNTPIERESTIGGQKTVAFRRTPPLPSYLVAIAAGPFEFVPIPKMSVPGRVVTVKGSSRLAGEAVRITPPILAALEKYFGRPYPFQKLDLLAVPEFLAGAMENPGAVTYREDVLLVDPATASVRQRYGLASTTAHELAHMWFGDLVTMEWWDDVWLNESFASWMGDKMMHQVFPQYHTPVRELRGTQGAIVLDARLSTRAIRQSVDAFANFDRLFDELAYQKGQAVLGMLENWLGPEVFRRGVLEYLKEHEWKNATAADLWRALSSVSGRDIASVTTSFLDRGGVPLVSLELQPDGKVRLRQRRFLNYGIEAPRATLWQIPVTLKYSDGRRVFTQSLLLGEAEQTVALERASSPAWVHPNASERGYYRWSVPPTMLQTIAASAPQALDTRERVGFLNNLSSLLDAGLLHGDEYLRTLARFTDDSQPEVVSALINGLDKVKDTFVTPALTTSYAIVVRQMLRPALKRFGMTRVKGEAEPVSLMRPNLLATLGVHGRDREVLAWGHLTARRYVDHPDSVDGSVAATALNMAARDGDLALFEEYRTRFETTTIPSERMRFLGALGNFRNGALVVRALDYALSGPLRPQEIFTIPRELADDEELKERIWNWLKHNHWVIVQRIPPFYLANLPHFAECCNDQRIADAQSFFSPRQRNPPGTQEELAKVRDSIHDCAGLREREGQVVVRLMTEMAQTRQAPGFAPGR
jgi:alanyl aminopeptidase